MKRTLAVLAAALLTTAVASAQSYPDPSGGAGTQLGIEELNTSGQVGDVTLFGGGPNTRVAVRMDGARGRSEAVRIYRGPSCDDMNGTGQPAYVLSNLSPHGVSHTVTHVSEDRLLSGNYNVVVLSSTAPGAQPVACGHLYR